MMLHVFVSSTRPNVAAFTNDITGDNLPEGYGRWGLSDSALLSRVSEQDSERVRQVGYALVLTGEIRPDTGNHAV